MLIGATFFGMAIVLMLTLDKVAIGSEHSRLSRGSAVPMAKAGERIGGSFWDGATAVARSPYLLGIGAFIVLMAISNTLIYFAVAQGMLDNTDTFSQRVSGCPGRYLQCRPGQAHVRVYRHRRHARRDSG